MREIDNVEIGKLKPVPDNPRGDAGELGELVASIKAVGVLEPLLVTPVKPGGAKGWYVVCGSRRLAAAKQAGLERVPVVFTVLDERERQEVMLIENLQREDLSPLEEAVAYRRLVDEHGLTQAALAQRVGRAQGQISKRLALLELPPAARKQLDSGGITIEEGLELTKLREHPAAMKAILSERSNMSVGQRVEQELAELERRAKVEGETAAIKAEGIPLLQLRQESPYYWLVPRGAAKLGGWDGLAISVKKHAKEPCHAAAVDRDGSRLYLCREPARHASDDPKAKRKTEADRRAERRRAHEKELRVAGEARRAHVGELLANGALPKAEAIELIFRGFLRHCQQEPKKIACKLLGLEPERRKGSHGYESIDYDGTLAQLAGKSERERLRVGAAISLGGSEQFLSGGSWHSWGGPSDKGYFEFLERQGYAASKAEKLELAGKAPAR